MTQKELSDLIGFSQQAVSTWLAGTAPRLGTAMVLAEKFPKSKAWDWMNSPAYMVRRALDGKLKPKRG
jgi:transcriptional regulator with XRE-family HTH domain